MMNERQDEGSPVHHQNLPYLSVMAHHEAETKRRKKDEETLFFDRLDTGLHLNLADESGDPFRHQVTPDIVFHALGFTSPHDHHYILGVKCHGRCIPFAAALDFLLGWYQETPILTLEIRKLGHSLRQEMRYGHPEHTRICYHETSLIEQFADAYAFSSQEEEREGWNLIRTELPSLFARALMLDQQPLAYVVDVYHSLYRNSAGNPSLSFSYRLARSFEEIDFALHIKQQDRERYERMLLAYAEREKQQQENERKGLQTSSLERSMVRIFVMQLKHRQRRQELLEEVRALFREQPGLSVSFDDFLTLYAANMPLRSALLTHVIQEEYPFLARLRRLKQITETDAIVRAEQLRRHFVTA